MIEMTISIMPNSNELIGIVAVDPQHMETLVMIKPGKKDPLFLVIDDYDWQTQILNMISDPQHLFVFTDENTKNIFSKGYSQLGYEITSLERRSAELGYYFSKIPQQEIQENEKVIYVEAGRGSTTGYSYQFDDFKFRLREKIIIKNTGPSGKVSIDDLHGLVFQLTQKSYCRKMLLVMEKTMSFSENELKIDFPEFGILKIFEYSPYDACQGCILYGRAKTGALKQMIFSFDHELRNIVSTSLVEKEKIPVYRVPKPIYLYDTQPAVMGIDLGTTRCSVAVSRNKIIEVVPDASGERSFPSYVCFEEAEPVIGHPAWRRLRTFPKSTIYDGKRMIGKDFIMIEQNPFWPFKVTDSGDGNGVHIEMSTISAILLAEMKRMASDYQADFNFHQSVTKAVITVPSFFNARQRQATIEAAKWAGIEVLALIDEPVAGALYFMADKRRFYAEDVETMEYLLIFDLGGGTLDVSILENKNGNLKEISRCGDLYLGGRDFDTVLVNNFRVILMNKYGVDPLEREKSKYKITTMVEQIKKDLSAVEETTLDPAEFKSDAEDVIPITRNDFELLSSSLLMRIKAKIAEALSEASKTPADINQVVYIGGSSKMPMINRTLKSMFPQSEHHLGADSECATAVGAMIHALQLLQ
uniref:Heat shock protein 70 n=1 Tax=Panagrolaimus sp. JU765 TaxID=591449 RepID=A0AC34Q697_9BILA